MDKVISWSGVKTLVHRQLEQVSVIDPGGGF
jgi:hypothetical protein